MFFMKSVFSNQHFLFGNIPLTSVYYDVYLFPWSSQPKYQTFKVQKTLSNCCSSSLSEKSPSSAERNPRWLWTNLFQNNKILSIQCSCFQTLLSSPQWINWLWLCNQRSATSIFKQNSFHWTHFMKKMNLAAEEEWSQN